jgi:hypothetical protein
MTRDFDVLDTSAETPGAITLFGDNDLLDRALTTELGRRGRRTHTVSIAMGWLTSASHAIVRLDTPSGAIALRELTKTTHPPAHVVAVCEKPSDERASDRLRELCRRCGEHHDVALIWHPPIQPEPIDQDGTRPVEDLPTGHLAATVADAVEELAAVGHTPSFAARTFEPSS